MGADVLGFVQSVVQVALGREQAIHLMVGTGECVPAKGPEENVSLNMHVDME